MQPRRGSLVDARTLCCVLALLLGVTGCATTGAAASAIHAGREHDRVTAANAACARVRDRPVRLPYPDAGDQRYQSFIFAVIDLGNDLRSAMGAVPSAQAGPWHRRFVEPMTQYVVGVQSWLDQEYNGYDPGDARSSLADIFASKREADRFARAHGIAQCVDLRLLAPVTKRRAAQAPTWHQYVTDVEETCVRTGSAVPPPDPGSTVRQFQKVAWVYQVYWAGVGAQIASLPAPRRPRDVRRVRQRLLPALAWEQRAALRWMDVDAGYRDPPKGLDEATLFEASLTANHELALAFTGLGMDRCLGEGTTSA